VIDAIAEVEQRELERRALAYRDDRPQPDVKNHVVILIDDRLATGSTMRAVEPLEPTPEWDMQKVGEPAETYPSGL
jgi:predicted phosphoribosyltransferase